MTQGETDPNRLSINGWTNTWTCFGWTGFLANGTRWGYHGDVHDQACIGFQAVTSRPPPWDAAVDNVTYWGKHGFLNRWYSFQRFSRDVGNTSETTENDIGPLVITPPRYLPPEQPFPFPALVPEVVPINVPVADPLPIPYRAIPYRAPRPHIPPGHSPERGPIAVRSPRPRPDEGTQVWPPTRRRPRARHQPRRPGPNLREPKYSAAGAAGAAVVRFLDQFTEGADYIEALWEALPSHAQTKIKGERTLPQTMAQDLWNNWDQIDLNEALINLLKNEIEDRAIGTANRRANDAFLNSDLGRESPIGIGGRLPNL